MRALQGDGLACWHCREHLWQACIAGAWLQPAQAAGRAHGTVVQEPGCPAAGVVWAAWADAG